jgi:diguanylate cyclase (GGDEF)-like protein
MNTWILAIPMPVALATVALIGYWVGSIRRRRREHFDHINARYELKRARTVIRQLEAISTQVRRSLARHHTSVERFKQRLNKLSEEQNGAAWVSLSEEADRVLRPTLWLSSQIAHAYDEIRQQTNLLMTFTEARTDALTGLSNRRAMDESLATLFAMNRRYRTQFALALLDVDGFKQVNDRHGHLHGDRVLKKIARILDQCARETDMVARIDGEQFAVVMPHTDLEGAAAMAERMRQAIEEESSISASMGTTVTCEGDCPRTLFARADAALYAAKEDGRNCVFQHAGSVINRVTQRRLHAPAPRDDADEKGNDESDEKGAAQFVLDALDEDSQMALQDS